LQDFAMHRALAAAAFLASFATPVLANDITVTLDEVRTLTFGVPVSSVYVGNPSIADINMIDARHAFVLGKGYGSTNIVALNHNGVQISNTRINVMASQRQSTVTLNRGAARTTYDCTADHCEATPQPGDGKDAFDTGNTELGVHQEIAKKAAAVAQ
jgi:Flp pilus assembly secretin CpaC